MAAQSEPMPTLSVLSFALADLVTHLLEARSKGQEAMRPYPGFSGAAAVFAVAAQFAPLYIRQTHGLGEESRATVICGSGVMAERLATVHPESFHLGSARAVTPQFVAEAGGGFVRRFTAKWGDAILVDEEVVHRFETPLATVFAASAFAYPLARRLVCGKASLPGFKLPWGCFSVHAEPTMIRMVTLTGQEIRVSRPSEKLPWQTWFGLDDGRCIELGDEFLAAMRH